MENQQDAASVEPDMRFDIDGEYTKAEFLLKLEYLKTIVPEMAEFFERRIPWAEAQPEETIFSWEIREDGVIYPVAGLLFSAFPDSPVQ